MILLIVMKKEAIYHTREDKKYSTKPYNQSAIQDLLSNSEKFACKLQGIPYNPKKELLGRKRRRIRDITRIFVSR